MIKAVDIEVLAVGAGPTGLVVASELRRRGIKCRIIDSLLQPSDKSRALAIHARTLELFEMMGIIDAFLKIGWQSSAFTVFDRKTQIVRMTFNELDSPFPYLLSLPQFDTERILSDQACTFGGVIERGATLRSMSQDSDTVQARIERADGTEETITCRFLVGCDGAHSAVRRMLNLSFAGYPYWEQYVLADVQFEASLDPRDHYLFSGEKGVAGLHAFSADSARIFADIGRIKRTRNSDDNALADKLEFPEPSHEELQSLLDQRGPGSVRLTKVNWVSMHRIHRRQVASYRSKRVFLAGDAAHLHSPTGGQGMNLGIHDAYNLAWKLALVLQRLAPDKLLDSYSIERHLAGKQVTVMSDFFTRINEVRSPLLRIMRNSVGPILARQDGIRHRYRRAVAGLSTNYRFSPASSEHMNPNGVAEQLSETAPKHGDRAPDALLFRLPAGEKMRLFELMRDVRLQLLLFAGPLGTAGVDSELLKIYDLVNTQHRELIAAHLIIQSEQSVNTLRMESGVLVDSDLSAHRAYGAQTACLYLIRPDGYVGFRCQPPRIAAFEDYLNTRFRT